jgi:hypothetical protein
MKTVSKKSLESAMAHYSKSKKPNLMVSSQKFGIGYETLRRHLKAQGVPTNVRVRVATPSKSEYKRKNPNPLNASKRWSASEDEMLKQAVESKMSVRDTCDLLGRSVAAVYARKCILLGNGFINDVRFEVEKGILRPRKVNPEPEDFVVEELVDVIPVESNVEVPVSTPGNVSLDFSINDLVSLVSEFGVSVTVTMKEGVTEVGISK